MNNNNLISANNVLPNKWINNNIMLKIWAGIEGMAEDGFCYKFYKNGS